MKVKLIVACVLCALWVASAVPLVVSQHERRALFVELQQLERERDEMQNEWGRLQLEQSTLANHERVKRLAINKLSLELPAADDIVLVSPQ